MFLPISINFMLLFINGTVSRFSYLTFIYMNCIKSIQYLLARGGAFVLHFLPQGWDIVRSFFTNPGAFAQKNENLPMPGEGMVAAGTD